LEVSVGPDEFEVGDRGCGENLVLAGTGTGQGRLLVLFRGEGIEDRVAQAQIDRYPGEAGAGSEAGGPVDALGLDGRPGDVLEQSVLAPERRSGLQIGHNGELGLVGAGGGEAGPFDGPGEIEISSRGETERRG
jgi:hypothetical protein